MSRNTLKKSLAVAMGATFVAAMSAAPIANADSNPFGMSNLDSGYMQVAEGKCGGSMKKDGDSKSKKEGSCGEGKDKGKKEGSCGESMMKTGEGKCGEDKKMKEGKCGEGKCGAGKQKKGEDE